MEAANCFGISRSSAYRFRRQWLSSGGVVRKKRGPAEGSMSSLKQAHTDFIINYIEKFATATIEQIKNELLKEFKDLVISKSGLQRHMKTHCALSLKRLEKIPAKRNDEDTIRQRRECVETFIADKDMDFERNCVFLDEAGFNLHIVRNRGWSAKGKPAKTIVPTNRGTSITILGAISSAGVIDISLRKPTSVTNAKKRKFDGKVVKITKGTNTSHYLAYLCNVMDVLDKNKMQGFYLVMDNAPIHGPRGKVVNDYIVSRGYKCVYLPPYSPFLNPIEEFWSKVKAGIKRSPVDGKDTLTPRILESCSKVTLSDCRGWIRHSVSFFPRCLAEEQML